MEVTLISDTILVDVAAALQRDIMSRVEYIRKDSCKPQHVFVGVKVQTETRYHCAPRKSAIQFAPAVLSTSGCSHDIRSLETYSPPNSIRFSIIPVARSLT